MQNCRDSKIYSLLKQLPVCDAAGSQLCSNCFKHDLAIMSIEAYEELTACNELHKLVQEGIDDIDNGRTLTEKEVVINMQAALGK